MYLNDKENIYEVFMKLNSRSANCVFLILTVPGDRRKCFVHEEKEVER